MFRGGTALLAAELLRQTDDRRALHLFDSFAGMPQTATGEAFQKGDFSRTSEAAVRALVSPTGANVVFHPGYIPDTFAHARIDRSRTRTWTSTCIKASSTVSRTST